MREQSKSSPSADGTSSARKETPVLVLGSEVFESK